MKKTSLQALRMVGIVTGAVFGLIGISSSILGFFGLGSMSSLALSNQVLRLVYYLLFTASLLMPYRKALKKLGSPIVLTPIVILILYTFIRGLISLVTDFSLISLGFMGTMLLVFVGNLKVAIVIYREVKGE